jgi:hypothetical protein
MSLADHLFLVFFSPEKGVNLTFSILGGLLFAGGLVLLGGRWTRRPKVVRTAVALLLVTSCFWTFLYVSRPVWLREAMRDTSTTPTAEPTEWTERAPGFETSTMEVRLRGTLVDRISLARLDPKLFDFSVHWDPSQSRTIENWRNDLDAAIVVNGSYFLPDASPETPLRIDGRPAGPTGYPSIHGAFVADPAVGILDLKGGVVSEQLAPYRQAMVSYPLLLDGRGEVRAHGRADWLANRTFVAIDSKGKVIFGITGTGFFSLSRLGQFLKSSRLDIHAALNLDGGPVACQSVHAGVFQRTMCGNAEISNAQDLLRLLFQRASGRHWKLPIVLAARPKGQSATSARVNP